MATATGLNVRSNGDKLLFFTERGLPMFSVFTGSIYDPNGMCFNEETVPKASPAEIALFPDDGTGD
jgi:hypothetical protein